MKCILHWLWSSCPSPYFTPIWQFIFFNYPAPDICTLSPRKHAQIEYPQKVIPPPFRVVLFVSPQICLSPLFFLPPSISPYSGQPSSTFTQTPFLRLPSWSNLFWLHVLDPEFPSTCHLIPGLFYSNLWIPEALSPAVPSLLLIDNMADRHFS